MKVLMLNGSPRVNSNCGLALNEMRQIFEENDIEVKEIVVGNKDIRGCISSYIE